MIVHAFGEGVNAFGERALPAASVLVPWRSQLTNPAEGGSPAKPVHPFRRRREAKPAAPVLASWRAVTPGEAERALALVQRIISILWRMTRG